MMFCKVVEYPPLVLEDGRVSPRTPKESDEAVTAGNVGEGSATEPPLPPAPVPPVPLPPVPVEPPVPVQDRWQTEATSPTHCESHEVLQQYESAAQMLVTQALQPETSLLPVTQMSCAQVAPDPPVPSAPPVPIWPPVPTEPPVPLAPPVPLGPHGVGAEAELRGLGAVAEKSLALLSVSVQPFDPRTAAVVLLKVGVGPLPS